MTALAALRTTGRGRQPATAEAERTASEELGVLRHEALTLCRHALPEARRVRMVFANLGPDFHVAEQLATNLVGRLESYERRFTPTPDDGADSAVAA